jgi:hypothetical protein
LRHEAAHHESRIACAVVLLPVLYLLNFGPVVYLNTRFHIPGWMTLPYLPLDNALMGTPLEGYYLKYEFWWMNLALPPSEDSASL